MHLSGDVDDIFHMAKIYANNQRWSHNEGFFFFYIKLADNFQGLPVCQRVDR